MIEFFQQLNWVIVGQIILIDILLGGDNAIVIALACRHLPEDMRFKGIVGGALGAIVIRIVLIAFAVTLLTVPYLKIIGGVLLLWIGVKLLFNQEEENDDIDGGDRLITAIKTVIIADLVMSIDNVIAVAGAAEQASADHKLVLVVLLIGYHHACGSLLKKFEHKRNTRSHVWFRWFNEVPVLVLFATLILVVLKPF